MVVVWKFFLQIYFQRKTCVREHGESFLLRDFSSDFQCFVESYNYVAILL